MDHLPKANLDFVKKNMILNSDFVGSSWPPMHSEALDVKAAYMVVATALESKRAL